MSTNTFKSFAVAGVGNTVGMPIVKSLLSRNAQVIVLTRPSSKKSFPDGNSVDVVISTLSGEGLHAQYKLADAAKAAGVKLFVPSEFGMPTRGATEGQLAEKSKLADYAQSIGLPITRVYNGLYQEFLPFTGNAELRIQGERSTLRELSKLYDVPVEFVDSIPKDIPRADEREWLQAYTAEGRDEHGLRHHCG
ncbi:hypothetical protein BKA83DRAFT_4209748 [Pisolithus microcarpus]|nr:hypothetical protein BKA83DRAFT_4209748 [Pisolithus microcarpus]